MTGTFPWPIQEIAGWMPLWKAAGFFFATFILEDVAAIGAGLLLAAGAISWPVAFASCFIGIWSGDAGLYALARLGGRKWFDQSRLKKFSAKVSDCEEWFNERGNHILVFSRCLPGARLPTYLAAGFLRLPLPKFLVITGAAAFVWTFIVLWLAETFGAQLVHWLNVYKHGAWILLCSGVALFFVFQWFRRSVSSIDLRQLKVKLDRWRRWEFWPAWLFYPPVAIYCLWLALKYRGLTVPTVANPGIFAGGLVGESKIATLGALAQTSPEFTARAELVPGSDHDLRQQSLAKIRARLDLPLPFILKPDLGQRGAGVKLIRTEAQAENYLRNMDAPLIVQRYAPGPFEVGIFYYRFPSEQRGRIFAITEKVFPELMGDGRHTVAELLERDPRARLIANIYLKRLASRRCEVLPVGQSLRLVEAGNHAQGCIFRDGWRLWSPELEARIDDISRKLDGFFIGRYDIRYASETALRGGQDFQIVELNGAASEATSIYDARNSLWSAYKTLFQQWDLVFAIGAQNRHRGIIPTSAVTVFKAWRKYLHDAAAYPVAD